METDQTLDAVGEVPTADDVDTDAPVVGISAGVLYRGERNQIKAALVIGTPTTIADGTSIAVPEKGRLHLMVFSPGGQAYPRYNVPFGEGPVSWNLQ